MECNNDDLDDGIELEEFDLKDIFAGASCNDIEIGPAGRGYVTDRQNPQIYHPHLQDQSGGIWANDSLLELKIVGLNGIAITPDEEAVIVTKYYPPRLLRIRSSAAITTALRCALTGVGATNAILAVILGALTGCTAGAIGDGLAIAGIFGFVAHGALL